MFCDHGVKELKIMDDSYFLLLICTFLCFLTEFLDVILKPVLDLLTQYGRNDLIEMRTELSQTKSEMDKLSITDDFSKYIKLQRKYNKMQDALKSDVIEQMKYSMKIKYGMKYIIYAIINIFYIFVCWSNWGAAVLTLPEQWLYPFSRFLSWPTSVAGGISVPNWLLISNVTAKLISKSIKSS